MNIFFASIAQNKKPFLFIINGESNSGGYALNSQAPIEETGLRDHVYILNNTSLIFESLNIGVNNLISHAGLSNGVTHGFELEIANRSIIDSRFKNSYIIKTGQGGSTISQWNLGGGYMNTFISRINAAKEIINFNDFNVIILFSLGINDALSSTPVLTWKNSITTHFENIRNSIGINNVPIIMTEFQGMGSGGTQYNHYNNAIQELTISLTNVYSVDVSGAALRDANHWDYNGMKFVTNLLLNNSLIV